jgi:hypothetical protein
MDENIFIETHTRVRVLEILQLFLIQATKFISISSLDFH